MSASISLSQLGSPRHSDNDALMLSMLFDSDNSMIVIRFGVQCLHCSHLSLCNAIIAVTYSDPKTDSAFAAV